VVPEPAESILTEGSIRAVTGPEVARNVLIRRATVDDVVPMGTLWLRAALAGYEGMFPPEAPKPTAAALTERWRQAIARGPSATAALVACHGPLDAVVGTVAAEIDRHGPYIAQVSRLYVDPDHWGCGVGRRLHDRVLEHLRAGEQGVVALWVLEANVRARSMYERWGWRSTTDRQTVYPGVDEIRYLRDL
jgi:GNAT superfamily N-acetyltransferase